MRKRKRIYFDIAASTPLDTRVGRAMRPYWSKIYGNAGAIHQEGVAAKRALMKSRETVARIMGARPDEVIFTSGGTESNALAIFGVIRAYEHEHGGDLSGLHVVTTTIEHPSVLESFRELASRGARVDCIDVDSRGFVDMAKIRKVITPTTTLVSVMYVNNEVGTIEPIAEIGRVIQKVKRQAQRQSSLKLKQKGGLKVNGSDRVSYPYFHTDASQAPLFLPIDVQKLGVDLLTIDAQKLYGPKGVGALYLARGVKIKPVFYGGQQEKGLRPGTEPIPLIVGLASSLAIAHKEREEAARRLTKLRDYFIEQVNKKIPKAVLNGDPTKRLPNNVNFSFPGFDNEFLIISLDARGIACSSRSACLTGGEGSYVVRALGKSTREAASSIRFSMHKHATKKEVQYVVKALVDVTSKS
jgi:cysteine desulfurase